MTFFHKYVLINLIKINFKNQTGINRNQGDGYVGCGSMERLWSAGRYKGREAGALGGLYSGAPGSSGHLEYAP